MNQFPASDAEIGLATFFGWDLVSLTAGNFTGEAFPNDGEKTFPARSLSIRQGLKFLQKNRACFALFYNAPSVSLGSFSTTTFFATGCIQSAQNIHTVPSCMEDGSETYIFLLLSVLYHRRAVASCPLLAWREKFTLQTPSSMTFMQWKATAMCLLVFF